MSPFSIPWSSHGQTLASRAKPGLSFQLQVWACMYNVHFLRNNKTDQLKVENSAQTTLRFSPDSFRAPRPSSSNWNSLMDPEERMMAAKNCYIRFANHRHA